MHFELGLGSNSESHVAMDDLQGMQIYVTTADDSVSKISIPKMIHKSYTTKMIH